MPQSSNRNWLLLTANGCRNYPYPTPYTRGYLLIDIEAHGIKRPHTSDRTGILANMSACIGPRDAPLSFYFCSCFTAPVTISILFRYLSFASSVCLCSSLMYHQVQSPSD